MSASSTDIQPDQPNPSAEQLKRENELKRQEKAEANKKLLQKKWLDYYVTQPQMTRLTHFTRLDHEKDQEELEKANEKIKKAKTGGHSAIVGVEEPTGKNIEDGLYKYTGTNDDLKQIFDKKWIRFQGNKASVVPPISAKNPVAFKLAYRALVDAQIERTKHDTIIIDFDRVQDVDEKQLRLMLQVVKDRKLKAKFGPNVREYLEDSWRYYNKIQKAGGGLGGESEPLFKWQVGTAGNRRKAQEARLNEFYDLIRDVNRNAYKPDDDVNYLASKESKDLKEAIGDLNQDTFDGEPKLTGENVDAKLTEIANKGTNEEKLAALDKEAGKLNKQLDKAENVINDLETNLTRHKDSIGDAKTNEEIQNKIEPIIAKTQKHGTKLIEDEEKELKRVGAVEGELSSALTRAPYASMVKSGDRDTLQTYKDKEEDFSERVKDAEKKHKEEIKKLEEEKKALPNSDPKVAEIKGKIKEAKNNFRDNIVPGIRRGLGLDVAKDAYDKLSPVTRAVFKLEEKLEKLRTKIGNLKNKIPGLKDDVTNLPKLAEEKKISFNPAAAKKPAAT